MLKTLLLDTTTEIPQEGNCYLIGKNGIFLLKDTGLIKAVVKLEGISCLKEIQQTAQLRLPKIPAQQLAQVLLFFRAVFQKYRAEANILLYYSSVKDTFMVQVTSQQVSLAGVKYDFVGKYHEFKFQLVGSIHSHCNFSAFHSGTDEHDEKDFDGLHITLGHVHLPYFTVSAAVVVNNNRFSVDIDDVVEGMRKVDYRVPRTEVTYRRIQGIVRTTKRRLSKKKKTDLITVGYDRMDMFERKHPPQFYDIVLPMGMDYRNCRFPLRWLDMLTNTNASKEYADAGNLQGRIKDDERMSA